MYINTIIFAMWITFTIFLIVASITYYTRSIVFQDIIRDFEDLINEILSELSKEEIEELEGEFEDEFKN